MKTQNVVIAVVVTNIVSILATALIVGGKQPEKSQLSPEPMAPTTAAAPVPAAPVVSVQPAVDKDKVLAFFDSIKNSRRKEAVAEFKKLMQDVPPYASLGTVTYGYRLALEGEYQKAIEATQKDINRAPERVDSVYTLAWIYAKVSDYDKALQVCSDALKGGAQFSKQNYIMGWVYAKQGKYEDALKACDAALSAEPYSPGLYYAKGRIEDIFGNQDKAIEYYLKAISLKDDFYSAYVYLGFLYTELGRYDEAIKTQKEAVALDKYGAAGYLGLGLAYDEMGNYQAALPQYQNAMTLGNFGAEASTVKKPLSVSLSIDDAVIFNRIGILNIRLGAYEEALAAFNQSLKARLEFHDAYRGLIMTSLLKGDKESAFQYYEKLKQANPEMAKTIAAFVEIKE